MALRLQISRAYITDDGETIELTNATGLYADNGTGFGAPNNDRNTYGIKLFVVEKTSLGDVLPAVTLQSPTSATGKTVTDWRYTNNIGGYYYYYMCAITDYAGGNTYALGEIVWDDGEGDWFEAIVDGESGNAVTDTAKWTAISTYTDQEAYAVFKNAETLADANDLMEFISNDDGADLLTINIDIPINRGILSATCVCDDLCSLDSYETARVDGEATVIMFRAGAYTTAQGMYEKLYNRL